MPVLESLFQSLETHGRAVSDAVIDDDLVRRLYLDSRVSWQAGRFREARIGRGEETVRQADIRGDSICWLDQRQPQPAEADFLGWAADLRRELNQRYFLGLKREEFHFSHYPVGTGYKKHVDQHRSTQHRKISLVLYLNPEWSRDDGGELCVYSSDGTVEFERVLPRGGRLVLFRSDLVPHEVLPCHQTRWALTGWFRTDELP